MYSAKNADFRQSVIRQMTQLAAKHKAINLSQGFPSECPDFAAVWTAVLCVLTGNTGLASQLDELIFTQDNMKKYLNVEKLEDFHTLSFKALVRSMTQGPRDDSLNQYSIPFGRPELREAISKYYKRFYNVTIDPETEITVTLGATEATSVCIRTIVEPGKGALIMEPFHESYYNQSLLFNLKPYFYAMKFDTQTLQWVLDISAAEQKITQASSEGYPIRITFLTTPHNPTGKLFSDQDLKGICDLCVKYDIYLVTDEIYEHIVFDKNENCTHRGSQGVHTCLLEWPGMRDRLFIVNSLSKTWSVSGWRVGWIVAPPGVANRLRAVHDTIAMQAPTPFQIAAKTALECDNQYFDDLKNMYMQKRDMLYTSLVQAGFVTSLPQAAYYFFAEYDKVPCLQHLTPMDAAVYMAAHVGVACVPGDNFYGDSGGKEQKFLRFAFCRTTKELEEACVRLRERL